MFFYFGKLAVNLFGPLGISVTLFIVALFLPRKPRVARTLIIGGIVILWAFSTHFVSQWLLRGLESQTPGYTVENAPQEPAIVVLGGFMQTAFGSRRNGQLGAAADRLVQGFRLFRAGKAPLILISGGEVPIFGKGDASEAEAARSVLEEWGVPESAILVETHSKNTAENAAFSRDLLAARGIHRVLLVTSAAHMPRAVRAFHRANVEVTPVPADFQTGWPNPDWPFRLLPDPEALDRSTGALREYFGLFVYRLRGWA